MIPTTNQTLVLVWLAVVSQDNIQKNHSSEKEEKMKKKMNFKVSSHNLNHLFTSDKKQGTKPNYLLCSYLGISI